MKTKQNIFYVTRSFVPKSTELVIANSFLISCVCYDVFVCNTWGNLEDVIVFED